MNDNRGVLSAPPKERIITEPILPSIFINICDDTSNNACIGSPLTLTAHEDRCSSTKSLDRVRICESCNTVRNRPYL
jgi:hypothetical protein